MALALCTSHRAQTLFSIYNFSAYGETAAVREHFGTASVNIVRIHMAAPSVQPDVYNASKSLRRQSVPLNRHYSVGAARRLHGESCACIFSVTIASVASVHRRGETSFVEMPPSTAGLELLRFDRGVNEKKETERRIAKKKKKDWPVAS